MMLSLLLLGMYVWQLRQGFVMSVTDPFAFRGKAIKRESRSVIIVCQRAIWLPITVRIRGELWRRTSNYELMQSKREGVTPVDLIAQLTAEHQDYVFKLSALVEVIEGIRVNGRGDYFIAALDALIGPLTTELDDHAHREEEFLFPRLLERAPDSPVAVMLEEHQTIRGYSAQFEHWYRKWREGADDTYDRWTRPALELRGAFSTHMQKENLILFPLARRVLTPEDISHLMIRGDH